MAAYRRVWLASRAGWLPRTGISSGTLRSVIEYGLPLPFTVSIQSIPEFTSTCMRCHFNAYLGPRLCSLGLLCLLCTFSAMSKFFAVKQHTSLYVHARHSGFRDASKAPEFLKAVCLRRSDHSPVLHVPVAEEQIKNKPTASYVRWQRGTARRTATDRYLLLAGPTAANLQQRVCCCGLMLGDGHRTVHRPWSAHYAGGATNDPHVAWYICFCWSYSTRPNTRKHRRVQDSQRAENNEKKYWKRR